MEDVDSSIYETSPGTNILKVHLISMRTLCVRTSIPFFAINIYYFQHSPHHLKIRPPLRGVLGGISALIIEVLVCQTVNNNARLYMKSVCVMFCKEVLQVDYFIYIFYFKCVSLKMKLRLRLIYFRLLAVYLFVCTSVWVLYAIRCCLQVFGKIGNCCNYVIINTRIVAYLNGIVVLENRMFMFLFSVLHISCKLLLKIRLVYDTIFQRYVGNLQSLHFLSP